MEMGPVWGGCQYSAAGGCLWPGGHPNPHTYPDADSYLNPYCQSYLCCKPHAFPNAYACFYAHSESHPHHCFNTYPNTYAYRCANSYPHLYPCVQSGGGEAAL